MAQAKRKKKFFDIEIPILKKETQLYGYDLKDLANRTISYDLTRLLKGKSALLYLRITIEGDKATAHPKELRLLPYFIRRMVRKGTDYVEDSFSAESKTDLLTIKPILVTRKKVSRDVKRALREEAKKEIINYVKSIDSDTLFDEILKNKIQKILSLKLKKIYPLSLCEIRTIQIKKKK